ncbi:hypothetical protein FCULG_00006496 [Fusarium culmorum]|uniref:Uncharacterized protein n=1 Tax=Fusarium culmorum TaxID=5516 RepID=A0A2T4GSY2_FUSCU|nr:hypothetical protein FCULG_00006496 [Fusarium culmorum]
MLEPRIGMQTLSQITSQNICRVTQLDQTTLSTRLVRCCHGATCTVTMRGLTIIVRRYPNVSP